MHKVLKCFLIFIFLVFIIIGGYNFFLKIYYSKSNNLNSIITMQIGDCFNNYRFMNKMASKAYLTSIKQLNNEEEYELSFRQYYNHDPYDFKYIVSENDYLDVYFCTKPFKKNKKCKLLIYKIDKNTMSVKLQ